MLLMQEIPKVAMVLNRPKLDELRRAHGIRSEAELARRIGVSPETLWRVSKGGVPSNSFMARVCVAFPTASFGDLFRVSEMA